MAHSSDEFGLDEILTECKVLLNKKILFDQMQPYYLSIS